VLATVFLLPLLVDTAARWGLRLNLPFEEVDTMSERLTRLFASRWGIILSGAVIGVLVPLVQKLGNPPSGTKRSPWASAYPGLQPFASGGTSLGLHRAAVFQYIRPGIIGTFARRMRFCTVESIRDVIMMGDTHLVS
jgi:hypothetical protein